MCVSIVVTYKITALSIMFTLVGILFEYIIGGIKGVYHGHLEHNVFLTKSQNI